MGRSPAESTESTIESSAKAASAWLHDIRVYFITPSTPPAATTPLEISRKEAGQPWRCNWVPPCPGRDEPLVPGRRFRPPTAKDGMVRTHHHAIRAQATPGAPSVDGIQV